MKNLQNLPGSSLGHVPHEVLVQRISLDTGSIRTCPYLNTSTTSMLVSVNEPKVSVHSTLPRIAAFDRRRL